jgi:hypothetical protein
MPPDRRKSREVAVRKPEAEASIKKEELRQENGGDAAALKRAAIIRARTSKKKAGPFLIPPQS